MEGSHAMESLVSRKPRDVYSPMPINATFAGLHEYSSKLKLFSNGFTNMDVHSPLQQEAANVKSKAKAVRYRECLRNHAVGSGGHAVDGCGEFMPSGEEGTVEALKCAACDCHRNFHRREVEGETTCEVCNKVIRNDIGKRQLELMTPGPSHRAGGSQTFAHPSQPQIMSLVTQSLPYLLAGPGPSADSDDGGGTPSTIKKRFRTKFTTEQKEKMAAFSEKLGWKIQKHDEAEVQEFCAEVGVKRHVLKVWMHNNKNTLGKKPNP